MLIIIAALAGIALLTSCSGYDGRGILGAAGSRADTTCNAESCDLPLAVPDVAADSCGAAHVWMSCSPIVAGCFHKEWHCDGDAP